VRASGEGAFFLNNDGVKEMAVHEVTSKAEAIAGTARTCRHGTVNKKLASGHRYYVKVWDVISREVFGSGLGKRDTVLV
jgi:hypothetical protein